MINTPALNTILDTIRVSAKEAHKENDIETLESLVNLLETASNEGGSYGMKAEKILLALETGEL